MSRSIGCTALHQQNEGNAANWTGPERSACSQDPTHPFIPCDTLRTIGRAGYDADDITQYGDSFRLESQSRMQVICMHPCPAPCLTDLAKSATQFLLSHTLVCKRSSPLYAWTPDAYPSFDHFLFQTIPALSNCAAANAIRI
jgi:hypothetical protein